MPEHRPSAGSQNGGIQLIDPIHGVPRLSQDSPAADRKDSGWESNAEIDEIPRRTIDADRAFPPW
jgi:hypothetical protein